VGDDSFNIGLDPDDGKMRFWSENNNDGGNSLTSTTASWTAGQWYHIICTWDTTNGKRIFIDGSLEATAAGETTLMLDGTNSDFYIGMYFDGTSYDFPGRIADVVTYHEILDSTDIANIYAGDYDLTCTPILHWDMQDSTSTTVTDQMGTYDGTISGALKSRDAYDQSGNDNDGTVISAIEVCDDINLFDGNFYQDTLDLTALDFNGVDDYVITEDNLPTCGSYSFCLWVKFDNVDTEQRIATQYHGSSVFWTLTMKDSQNGAVNGRLSFKNESDGNGAFGYASGLLPNIWYHVGVSTHSSNGDGYLYLNGENKALFPIGYPIITQTEIILGIDDDLVTIPLNGKISDLLYWQNIEITQNEFIDVMNGDYNIQTGNLEARYDMTQTSGTTLIDQTTNGNDATIVGATEYNEYLYNEILNDSLEFDGTDDYVYVPSIQIATPFSVSFWVNFDTVSVGQETVTHWQTTHFTIRMKDSNDGNNDGELSFNHSDGGNNYCSAAGLQAGTWYHVVCTADGTNQYIYIDGVQRDTTTSGASDVTTELQLGIYSDESSNALNGKIDEVRIYDKALTADEVTDLFTSGQGSNENEGSLSNTPQWKYTKSSFTQVAGHSGYSGTLTSDPTPELFSYYELESDAIDSTSNSLDLSTIGTGQSYGSGHVNNCVTLTTSGGLRSAAGDQGQQTGNIANSMFGWFNITSQITTGSWYLTHVGNIDAYDQMISLLYEYNGGTYQLRIVGEAAGNVSYTKTLTPDTWYYIGWTYDTDKSLHLWVDNVDVANNSRINNLNLQWPSGGNTGRLCIGTYPHGGGYGNFKADQVEYWETKLSDTEISTLYNSGAGLAYSSTSIDYTFIDTTLDLETNELVGGYCTLIDSGSTKYNYGIISNTSNTITIDSNAFSDGIRSGDSHSISSTSQWELTYDSES